MDDIPKIFQGMPTPDPMPEGADPDAPRIIRIMNMSLSIQAIYFIKTRRVIATAGYVQEKDRWLSAILHMETQKLVVYTKPAFKNKNQALEFGTELIDAARRTKLS